MSVRYASKNVTVRIASKDVSARIAAKEMFVVSASNGGSARSAYKDKSVKLTDVSLKMCL
jgi:hypothetical protein